MFHVEQTVHIQLGRAGDLIILLPCWWKIFQQTGQKPVVVVAREFSSVLNGASYVVPDPINGHWFGGMATACRFAKLKYGKFVITQCHGVGHETDKSKYPTFGDAMWSKAGFPGMYGQFPLVFDRRNEEREAKLVAKFTNDKPMILFNLMGLSSPLPSSQEIHNRLRRYAAKFNLVHLGSIRAKFLYDLLGLYDAAAGLISIDTATLHLANASKVPLLAYCRGGWSTAIPKPGAVRVEYSEAHEKLDIVDSFIKSL